MTMDQLPKTLFKEGTETQVEKVNNTCRTSILKKVEKYVEAEYKEVLGDPLFAQVMAIYVYKLKYSGRVIHSFVCKQLLTAKRHELWFHFARRALRFSVQEFLAITGLKYKDDDPYLDFDNWRGDKGLRMVYLCVIAGLVMAKGEKVCIPHKYIKLVMDFDKMRKFLWGLHSFDALVTSITEANDKAIPDIGSLLGEKLREGVTSMRCRNWKGSAKVSYEDIISIESDFASTGVVFPYISSTGNGNIIVDAGFERDDEMNDERETVQPYAYNSEEDGSKEEEAGETSDCRMEEEIETAHVSPAKKRKNHYQDIGAESRKKRLLCQRSTDKYRDLEEGMKSYIQGMFKSSFTALGLEVRDLIEDRFTKLEQTILSSQTQIGVPAYTQTHGAAPAYTPTPAPPTTSTQAHGAAPAYTPTPAAATTSTQAHGAAPAYTPTLAAATTSTQAPTPTPASTHASAPAPTTSRSRASRNKALVSSDTGGPANAAKTRSQTKDPDLSDVFGSLFDTLDVNLGTQEHLQKTMGNLTQESHVRVAYDPEVRWKDSDYELVFVPEDKCSKLSEWILKSKVLQIGPSNFDAELASRIMGPNEWLKNYDMDAMMYLFREKISLRRWKPNRVAFMNCMFSNQIITAYGKFDGNKRGYKVDNNLLEYGRGELPYHGSTGSVWSVDVDRLYIPICVNQIHWISMCVNLVNRTVEVFDCGGKKNNRAVEAFAVLIPRIAKAVQSSDKKKDFNVKQYTVSYVPMRALNKSGNYYGAYSLRFIECHLLGLDFSLVNDENIQEARLKIAFDLWEAANDEALQYRMSTFKPPKRAPEKTVELF
ncbi:BnaC01g28620D [Brassica napus]|uniref:BnaC01g28620D protein n=1 Tax=Brassica napus TaxID=3708 RepID=A0A078H939_BRANA|nr:BnaC01g28620D [Brassica napus]